MRPLALPLTHLGRVTHICVCKLNNIDSDDDLSPGRHQAIAYNNAGMLLIRGLGTNFSKVLSGIQCVNYAQANDLHSKCM